MRHVFHNKPVDQSPVVRVTPQLLGGILSPVWTVDWGTAKCPVRCQLSICVGAVICPTCAPNCVKGARIICNHPGGQIIWIMTGEYDVQTGLYEARWPD